MKLLLLWLIYSSLSGSAQSQGSSFTLGPIIGVDQFLSSPQRVTDPAVIGDVRIHYKPGFLYGLGSTYSYQRLLIDARLLTTKRVYEVRGPYPYNPIYQVRVRVEAPYYSVPITVSYRLKTAHSVQLFGGVGIVGEWVRRAFERYSFDIYGSGRVQQLPSEEPAHVFSVGVSAQLIGRYALSPRFWLQIQPTMHYFSKVATPFATTDNSSLSVSGSVSYQLK